MLNILEVCLPFHGYNLAALGADNPQFFHFMIEAKKIAYSVLHRYDADPKFAPVPLDIPARARIRHLSRQGRPLGEYGVARVQQLFRFNHNHIS